VKAFDELGRELDAAFAIAQVSGGIDLVIESRGGSATGPNPARNPDYIPAVALLLERLGSIGAVLTEIAVVSQDRARNKTADRVVTLPDYRPPVELSSVGDFGALRLSIGKATAAVDRPAEAKGAGNYTKRIRLRAAWPMVAQPTLAEVENALVRGAVVPEAEEPTSDPLELGARATSARRRMRSGPERGGPPPGNPNPPKTPNGGERIVRDPEVVAWVLEEAAGLCEVCSKPAPFTDGDGEPFLEVHHVRPLSAGGPDQVDNAIAACPNCHRRLHSGGDRAALRAAVIASVARLTDHPMRMSGPEGALSLSSVTRA
jgi:5-methylcytosine-specific restriction protein A